MIRVNLLRGTVTNYSPGKERADSGGGSFEVGEGSASSAKVVLKLIIALMPGLGLYAYEHQVITEKKTKLAQAQKTLTETKREFEGLKLEIEALQKFQDEKTRVEGQIEAIKNLSKERLRNVKSLATLQGVIPEKVWLTNLKIDDRKVEIGGQAVEDTEISKFMQALEESVYFAGVNLAGSQEATGPEGVVKEFKVMATLEENM